MTKQIDVDTWVAPETQDTGALPDDKDCGCGCNLSSIECKCNIFTCRHFHKRLNSDWYRKPPMDEDEAMERAEDTVTWNQNDEANYQHNILQ